MEKLYELQALFNKKGDPKLQYLLLYFRVVLTHTPDSIIETRKYLHEYMAQSRAHYSKINYFRGLIELVDKERSSENYQEMFRALMSSLDYARDTLKDPEMTGIVYGNFAMYYADQLDTIQAIAYSKKFLEAVTLANSLTNMASASNSLAMFYLDHGEYDTAKFYFLYSISLSQKSDGALMWPEPLINLSEAYRLTHDYDSALFYARQSIRLAIELNRDFALSGGYWETARSFRAIGKSDSALVYYKLAKELIEKGNYDSDLLFYTDLADFYFSTGNYKLAYEYLQKATAQKDVLFNSDNNKVLKEMDAKYQASKKEQEIMKQEEQIKRQRILNYSMIAVAVFFLLLIFFIYRSNRQKQKSNKELAVAKERAERSEKFKQQFLANMSHEIRTPLNSVMGMTELVLDSPLNSKQKKYLTGVKKASDNLLHIINDILDLSKIEAGKIEIEQIDFSLRDVIEQVSETLKHKADEKGISLIADVQANIPDVVIGDPVRLNQVLMNLAGNAIKFTEKGSVSIHVIAGEERTKQSAQHEKIASFLAMTFKIEDTGIGIPKEKLEHVFESFSQAHSSDTRKFGGTGLGLTISKQLVELMGGKISIESEEGSGSTFSFILEMPIGSKEKLLEQKSSAQIDGSILNGLKILLVDDNEDNRIVCRDTLESKATVEITGAINGQVALDLLAKQDFDLVLMDVQMPVMDGYEATRNIREKFAAPKNQIPVIALTASVSRSDLDKCRQAGMTDYIPKPFKTSLLISAIAKATGREIKFLEKNNVELNNAKTNNGAIDLSSLEEFCEGDKERIKKYIYIFLQSSPLLIEKLNAALKENNFEDIANQVHGFKTKCIMMGMNDANELVASIEHQCRKETSDYISIKANTIKLITFVENAATELKLMNNHV
ncbi:MAG: ATP-binding protein [Bacteroidia bacterium]